MLIQDIQNAVADLENLKYPTPSRIEEDKNRKGKVYTH
jgi:hypothetical protein